MEWIVGIAALALILACPLMMLGMIVGGWLFARRAGGSTHTGHGMMMCCGGHGSKAPSNGVTLEELKEERERLDRLIGRAERPHLEHRGQAG